MPFESKYFINVGDNFGTWTVLSIEKSIALCSCKCGIDREVRVSDLITGRSFSCGKRTCRGRFKNLLGLRFGFLQVTEMTDKVSCNGSIIWKCRCCCGNDSEVSSKHLLSGGSKSCGCKKIELKLSSQNILSDEDRIYNKIIYSYKKSAKDRNLEYSLSREEIIKLVLANCFYCGLIPSNDIIIKKFDRNIIMQTNGIDRVDSSLGYTLKNSVSCCWTCNCAKSNMSLDYFLKWAKTLAKFQNFNALSDLNSESIYEI